MKAYTINDYLNANYEKQNKIMAKTKLRMLILDILSLCFSFCGLLLLEIEVNLEYRYSINWWNYFHNS